ncbi:hypothetical protein, partial [Xenorhabdus cabanillasii]|uniref:hypothetical protein n=1 Tax=Xenorhabdus cabanillasii TaxID=351673 RepID=UPI001E4C081F
PAELRSHLFRFAFIGGAGRIMRISDKCVNCFFKKICIISLVCLACNHIDDKTNGVGEIILQEDVATVHH